MGIVERLVPDGLWEVFQDVAPEAPQRPQGGGRRRCDDRAVLAAIVFVATSGCTWRQLPPVFGASWQTVHRRFADWSAARVWAKLHRVLLDRLGSKGDVDWSRCVIHSISVHAVKGALTGPNPTDRGKNGPEAHVICHRNGLPISVGVSAANLHDSQALVPMRRGIPPIRSHREPRRPRPARLHTDKGYDGYDFDHLRNWLRRRQTVPRIARRGMDNSGRLGRHRWVVERTLSWMCGCLRLHRRYERKAEHILAFIGIASALNCYRRNAN
ncbi:IS5 family transposase [Streptomyces luteosporeus]